MKRARRAAVVALAVALVAPAALPAIGTDAAATTSTDGSCDQSAIHDAFRTAEAGEVVNETGEATSTTRNTKARVEDDTGFIRIHATNPNGYCVAFTVEISPEIVAPAELGEVDSVEESITAEWRAVQNLSSGAHYTQVTFVLQPGASATWAPSSVRVKSLAWTGEAENKTSGWFDRPSWLGGEDDLENRTYEISPANGTDAVTVQLTSTDGREVEDWQASYTYEGRTQPVDQDANAPVYYSENGDSVTFHFNERDANVSFTANPTWLERRGHEFEGYSSGWESISDWLPFHITPRRAGG